MAWKFLMFWLVLSVAAVAALAQGNQGTQGPVSIEIDLSAQRAYLLQGGQVVFDSPISSGRPSHPTPTGRFRVQEKDPDHRSSLYGKIVDGRGRTLVSDANTRMRTPPGGRFVAAPMRFFLRFRGPVGMHAGILPGYPASHSCVRLPRDKAVIFYQSASIGTPVTVYGRAN